MAEKTKLFLHIGPHKTGSTCIQKYCSENRDHLLKLGVSYPATARLEGIAPYGQHEAVEKTKTLEQGELDQYFGQFLGLTVLISSEEFSALTLSELAKLRQALAPFDTRIVYFKRNCLDVLPSTWQQ